MRARFSLRGPTLVLVSALVVACGGTAGPSPNQSTDAPSNPAESTSVSSPAASEPSPATSAGAGGLDEARQIVESVTGPVQWMGLEPALDVGQSLAGKKAYFVGNLSFEFDQNLLAGYEEAAEALGMEVVAVDAAGSAAQAGTLIEQAVAQNADVIVNKGFPESAIEAPLMAAKEAGIPVIGIGAGVPELPPQTIQDLGVPAFATFCYPCAGREMAAWVVADSGGDANVAIFQAPELSVTPDFNAAVAEELERLCSDCAHMTVDLPLAQWQAQLAGLTSSTLQANPDVNYIVALFDPMTSLMVPAIEGMDAQDRVKIVARGAAPAAMQLLKDGKIHANMGGPQRWLGWALMDQSVRALLGEPALPDEKIPNRLFTSENVGSIDLTAPESEWYGDVDYGAEYRALWGLD